MPRAIDLRVLRLACVFAPVLACAAPDDSVGVDPGSTGDSTGEPAPVEYWLPIACGATARVGQGNASDFSHNGDATYAFDILLALDTPVYAMADGTVLHIRDDIQPGDPCHDGGDESCFAFANLVVLLHADSTTTLYKHLNSVAVAQGTAVTRGDVLGLSGSTGWSLTPHLHAMRMQRCDEIQCPSIALAFADVPDGGVPVTGQIVTSMNCR